MSEMDYAWIAGGAIVFVVIAALILRFDAAAWIGRDLQHGDLYSMIDVASGLRPDGLTREQARRLEARGMVRRLPSGNFRVTLKGRLALRIREALRK